MTPLVDAAYADLQTAVGSGDWDVLLGVLGRMNAGMAESNTIEEADNR